MGAALAAWLAMRGPTTRRNTRIALEVVGLAGVVVLALVWRGLDGQSSTLYRGGFLVCGLAATAVIAASTHPDRGPIARTLSWRPLCALGLISYGVYLYHWPIDIFLDHDRVGLSGWPLFFVQTAVTIVIAIASYFLVEQPIRRGAVRPQQWGWITPAVAVALVAGIVLATTGAESLPSNPLANKDPLQTARHAFRHARPGSVRVMVVGNSVGYFLAEEGFAAIRTTHRPQLTVLDAAVPACVFPPELASPKATANGVPQPPCHPSWEAEAVKLYRPKFVFWITSDPVGAVGTYHGERVRALLGTLRLALRTAAAQGGRDPRRDRRARRPAHRRLLTHLRQGVGRPDDRLREQHPTQGRGRDRREGRRPQRLHLSARPMPREDGWRGDAARRVALPGPRRADRRHVADEPGAGTLSDPRRTGVTWGHTVPRTHAGSPDFRRRTSRGCGRRRRSRGR